MNDTRESDESSHFVLPPAVFYLLLAASGLGGGGIYGVVGPQLEKAAIQACYDNSQAALTVAADHGSELLELGQRITKLDDKINDRTKYRWTAEDQAGHERDMDKKLDNLYRRVIWLEEKIK